MVVIEKITYFNSSKLFRSSAVNNFMISFVRYKFHIKCVSSKYGKDRTLILNNCLKLPSQPYLFKQIVPAANCCQLQIWYRSCYY